MSTVEEITQPLVAALLEAATASGHSPELLWQEIGRQLSGHAPPGVDGWLTRVMVFDSAGDLQADSMPDQDVNAIPDVFMKTLPETGAWVRATCYMFHAERREPQPVGLDDATLQRAILSLRVSLSRSGGVAWWRIPYTVDGVQWRVAVRVMRAK
jgi:hypothetical protein